MATSSLESQEVTVEPFPEPEAMPRVEEADTALVADDVIGREQNAAEVDQGHRPEQIGA